jgi:glycosyltransferase involved in cell wall biosynthesis
VSHPLPRVSVVVPTRNRASLLPGLLEALERQRFRDFEVIVVDDGSTDGTPDVLGAWEREGRAVIRLERSAGSYAARNAGWKAARGEIVAFTDDDCFPQPAWLSGLLRALNDPSIAAAQGVTLAEPGEISPFTHQIDQQRPGPPYRTCNMAYRHSVLERLGGFEEMPWYADNILGLRARQLGSVIFAPDAIVLHPPGPRTWRDRRAWRARFGADAIHRRWLHVLGVEPVRVPGPALPVVLWVLRPLVKQTGAHLAYALRHPGAYARQVGPMIREKGEMLAALAERWRGAEPPSARFGVLPPSPLVSIVVVTRNRSSLLAETLAALNRQRYAPLEVLVVDHGRDPATREMAGRCGARYLEASGGTLADARQAGVDAAGGEIVAFTDDDCLPSAEWLMEVVGALQRKPELAGVQGRTETQPGPVGSHGVRVTRPNPLYQTCNMAYRREALLRVGGFDPAFHGWFEDTALAARVLEQGPIGFVPEALVIHRAMPRTALHRRAWRVLLEDERRLARRYPTFYRRTRGPGFLPTVLARWLIGSPLKTLGRELPGGVRHPAGYAGLARLLVHERGELLLALKDLYAAR